MGQYTRWTHSCPCVQASRKQAETSENADNVLSHSRQKGKTNGYIREQQLHGGVDLQDMMLSFYSDERKRVNVFKDM